MTGPARAIRSGHRPTLFAAFLYFDVSFMVWVLIGALGVLIGEEMGLSPTLKGVIVAVPLLGGSIFRLAVGILSDRLGPKKVGMMTLAVVLIPLAWGWLAADTFSQLIGLGLLLGVAGASFAVALPLASRWYPPEHQGIAMGVAGAGNSGTVLAVLLAPRLAESLGWHGVFGAAILPVIATLALFGWLAREAPPGPDAVRGSAALPGLLAQTDLWRLCLCYSVTFGGFVGLAGFLGIFIHDQYGLSATSAGKLTALCVLAGSLLRPVGGYLADRIGGWGLLTALYLSAGGLLLAVGVLPPLPVAAGLLILATGALGMGNGAVFQIVPGRFRDEIGAVSGFVGAAGGIGGFLLPILLGRLKDLTNFYGAGFIVYGLIALCLAPLAWVWGRGEVRGRIIVPPVDQGQAVGGRVRMEVVFGG